MPSLTANIQPNGPIIQVAVLVSNPRRAALQASGQPVPQPVFVNGLIDTGASCTCVDPTVITQLRIPATGSVPIITPSTGAVPHACNQYDVSIAVVLGVNHFKIIDTLPVIATALAHQGHEVLIGRDVLADGVLFYNGENNTVTISF